MIVINRVVWCGVECSSLVAIAAIHLIMKSDSAILYMSSGESAYQNIMSWLALVAVLENVASSETMIPKKNILLCIDEIDALCYPQWQRDIIGRLIDDIKEQYQGYSVQLILSTHSPLCLSDAAAENILYMENKNGKIIARRRQVQAFARNIYDILNDSFYLQGQTMGTYVTRYIAELIGVIRNESVENLEYQREILMQKIDIIGDPLIRGKLMQMLTERLTDGKNMWDRKRILEEQKLRIERRLYDLEEES